MPRLAYFVSHPIQYQAPLLRQIAADPDIQIKVFFYSDFSLKSFKDIEFNQVVQWDVPLVAGYAHEFLECWGSNVQKSLLNQPIAKHISKILAEGEFDAVWVHGWSWLCSLQAILAAEKLGIPILLRGETYNLAPPSSSLKLKAKKIFLNWLFQKISGFLCIGTLNQAFYQSYGVDDDRLFSMPYAVDNAFFQQQAHSEQREHLQRSLNLEPGRPIILYAAKLIAKKRPQDLLDAYRLLSVNGAEPEPYLLFVGDGDLRSHLEAEAQSTGWNSIRFLGFRNQSELPNLYALSDVFVLPSDFEPWGLAINEAMNAGKAVIVSDRVGCAPDLVSDQKNGCIFPVGHTFALSEALRWTIANSDWLGCNSLARIQQWSFSEDLEGLKYALNQILSRRHTHEKAS